MNTTPDLQAPQALDSTEMSPNLQEARSIRYVVGLRIARLSSGDFAVWGPQGGLSFWPESQVPGWLQELARADQQAREALSQSSPVGPVASLEDMGL